METSLYQFFDEFITQFPGAKIQEKRDNRIIFFSVDDLNFTFVSYQEKDYYYFRMFLPKVAKGGNDDFRNINEFNKKFKVGKAYVYQEEVWFAFEHFIINPETDGKLLFSRALSVLKNMIKDWRELGTEGGVKKMK